MIEVYVERKGTRCRLYVVGHAAYAEGPDIVCAGVSALTGALLDYAERCGNCRHLRTSMERGRVFLSCHGGLGAAFDMTVQGLSAIAESYPQCMRMAAAFYS